MPSGEEVAQLCHHIFSPMQRHVYLGQDGGYPAGLSDEGVTPRARLPRHGGYPCVAVLVTCPSTRVSDAVLLIAGSWERHHRLLNTPVGPWRIRRLRFVTPCVTARWSLVLNSPHAARGLLRNCVILAPGHLFLVGLISRHWAAPWPSWSTLLSLCPVLTRPGARFLPREAARAPCVAGLLTNSLFGVYSRALRPSVAALCPSLFECCCREYFCEEHDRWAHWYELDPMLPVQAWSEATMEILVIAVGPQPAAEGQE